MNTLLLLSTVISGLTLPICTTSMQQAQTTQPPAIKVQNPSLAFLLSRLPKETGANIYADTATGNVKINVESLDLTVTNQEDFLDKVLKQLPKATVWVKVYLPKTDSKRLTGDALAAYVFAQSNILGKVGEIKKGYTEILGQQVPDDQAATLVKTLNLVPSYIIFRPGYVDRTEELTGAEREALIERLIARPDLRAKYASDHGKIMGEVLRKLVKEKAPAIP